MHQTFVESERLFDTQLQTLANRGCDDAIIKQLRTLRAKVIGETSQTTFNRGHIPFLPVIPTSSLHFSEQVRMIELEGRKGCTWFAEDVLAADKYSKEPIGSEKRRFVGTPAHIRDADNPPNTPYYVINVGVKAVPKLIPEKVEQQIKRDKRFPLTGLEGISLALHGGTPWRPYNSSYFSGSRFYEEAPDGYPRALSMHTEDGRPVLTWGYLHLSDYFTMPHCEKRISA